MTKINDLVRVRSITEEDVMDWFFWDTSDPDVQAAYKKILQDTHNLATIMGGFGVVELCKILHTETFAGLTRYTAVLNDYDMSVVWIWDVHLGRVLPIKKRQLNVVDV